MNVEARHHCRKSPPRFIHAEQLGHGVSQCVGALVPAAKRHRGHRVAQHAGRDRVALGVIAVEEAFRRRALDHLGQFPSEVDRILHAGLEALPTIRGMDVGGVAGEQYPSLAIGCGLPGRIGKAGDRGGIMDPVVFRRRL